MGPSIPEKGEKFGILLAVNHQAAPFRLGRLWKLLPLDAAPFIIENKLKDSWIISFSAQQSWDQVVVLQVKVFSHLVINSPNG